MNIVTEELAEGRLVEEAVASGEHRTISRVDNLLAFFKETAGKAIKQTTPRQGEVAP